MRRRAAVLAFGLAAAAGAAHAEVTDRSAQGFAIVQRATIAAPEAKVWAAMLQPGAWWSGKHSWSGSAKNLYIDMARDCFCETLPNGGRVRHMTVTYNDNAGSLRFEGALGPLGMTGASGHMGWHVQTRESGAVEVTITYDVGGYAQGGLAEKWAGPVDQVLGEQLARLKRYAETGKPE